VQPGDIISAVDDDLTCPDDATEAQDMWIDDNTTPAQDTFVDDATQAQDTCDNNAEVEPLSSTVVARPHTKKRVTKSGKAKRFYLQRGSIRYNGILGYYTCYFIFIGFVGFIFMFALLTLHLIRCCIWNKDGIYECFVSLPLGPPPRKLR